MPILLSPAVQHYAWGGDRFLSDFIGRPADDEPTAEVWFGDHPKGPAVVVGTGSNLSSQIQKSPEEYLGQPLIDRFGGRLPFLLKVLDVKQMLSIQVHPDKGTAEAGFAREEQNGPARTAPNRNYRDDNHKPELGLAVSDFYLLHGFREEAAIRKTLRAVPGWAPLEQQLDAEGVPGLYEYVMRAGQATVDGLLQPLADQLAAGGYTRDQPEFWAHRAVEQYTRGGHHDRGMFSIFWFNLVHLQPLDAIFQDAGIPHAYLEGRCIELMANSDNVLRGGLTPKHIDVDELLLNTRFGPVEPDILFNCYDPATSARHFHTPAPDFALSFYDLDAGEEMEITADRGPVILLLWFGEVALGASGSSIDEGQRAAFLRAGETVTLRAGAESMVYRAEVGRA